MLGVRVQYITPLQIHGGINAQKKRIPRSAMENFADRAIRHARTIEKLSPLVKLLWQNCNALDPDAKVGMG
jgi:hypothetical protein